MFIRLIPFSFIVSFTLAETSVDALPFSFFKKFTLSDFMREFTLIPLPQLKKTKSLDVCLIQQDLVCLSQKELTSYHYAARLFPNQEKLTVIKTSEITLTNDHNSTFMRSPHDPFDSDLVCRNNCGICASCRSRHLSSQARDLRLHR